MNKLDFLRLIEGRPRLGIIGPLFSPNNAKLPSGLPLILVDGGADLFSFHDASPILKVGDGDSSKVVMDELLPQEKDFSDLSFALSLIPNFVKEVYLEGFLGGRKDHEYANLGEIHQFLKKRSHQTKCFLGSSFLGVTPGKLEIEINGSFSLLSLEKSQISSLKGDCHYQLLKTTTFEPLSSHGLSNWGKGQVEINCDKPFFIFFNPCQE